MTSAVIHQPNYLPGLSYFDKMAGADAFVLLDNVQFAKRNWTNRNKIKTADGPKWLTVPVVTKGRYEQLVRDVEVDATRDWQIEHTKALELSYSRAEYFRTYEEEVVELLSRPWTSLAMLNESLLVLTRDWLGIQTPMFRASDLPVEGQSSDLLVSICHAVGADCYVSGPGGRKYLAEEKFESANIRLVFQEYEHPVYRQQYAGFEPNLSVLDLLFNEGPRSLDILRSGARLQAA